MFVVDLFLSVEISFLFSSFFLFLLFFSFSFLQHVFVKIQVLTPQKISPLAVVNSTPTFACKLLQTEAQLV